MFSAGKTRTLDGNVMTYVWIFGGSYLAALAMVLTVHKNRNDLAAVRLRENGVPPENVKAFYRDVNRKSAFLLARSILVLGTIAGAVLSTAYLAVT